MRTIHFGWIAASILALAACGDDSTGGGGSGGSGATGGGGGNPTTGGTGGTGGDEGGGGAAPGKPIASPCMDDAECSGDVCMPEDYLGWAGGYCTQLCDAELAPCPEGAECLTLPTGGSACIKTCNTNADCTGIAQTCVDISGDGSLQICYGGCNQDTDCQVACNADTGGCTANAEVCDNNVDDDGDFGDSGGYTDCEDADCAADSTCMTAISGACTAAIDVSAGGTFNGNTANGVDGFATLCQSLFGSYVAGGGRPGLIYKYTATEAGTVTFNVTTGGDTVDWWIRSDCADAATSGGFCSTETGGPAGASVQPGDTFFVFVDGYGADANFTLDVSFVAIGPLCAAAQTINLGTTNGNTTNGTSAFTSSCGGGGAEQLYKFTPATSGVLNMVLSSATDQGIHVRTDCTDSATEAGCADAEVGGTDENLQVPVTANQPITIFVDAYFDGEEGPYTLTLSHN
ncbi:MAG: hypothetical protein U0271_43210 [Polyangiaceae bacterium]